MHRVLSTVVLSCFATITIAASEPPSVADARQKAKMLGDALKERLQNAIQQGGFPAGVSECHLAAMPVTERFNRAGWAVGRTALKLRNPANTPDTWEKQQLNEFAKRLKSDSEHIPEASYYDAQKGEFRYMRAIVTRPVCTGCHGASVGQDVKAVIDTHYPNDEATGFAPGSLRGAFTLSWEAVPDSQKY